MTFCAAIKVAQGLVAMADSRITSGTEQTTNRKISIHQYGRHSLFLMTAGLRAVRDKAVTYFDEELESSNGETDRLYKAVNHVAAQVRRVAAEDKTPLESSGLTFDLQAIVGGQLERDTEHKLYLLYSQGNWVEVSPGSPYFVIGESAYGKPLIDWTLRYEDDLATALKIAFLAFEAARTSSVGVGFPLDVAVYRKDSYTVVQHRFERHELEHVSNWWAKVVAESVRLMPNEWVDTVLAKLPASEASASQSAILEPTRPRTPEVDPQTLVRSAGPSKRRPPASDQPAADTPPASDARAAAPRTTRPRKRRRRNADS